jgi:hypothetical protein
MNSLSYFIKKDSIFLYLRKENTSENYHFLVINQEAQVQDA